MRKWCRRMHLASWKSPLGLLTRWHPCLWQQEDAGRAHAGLTVLWRCRRRRSGLPARLIVTLFTFLCVANLKHGSLQSLATKPRILSRRWRSCWGPSTGTQWRRPAIAWGPGSGLPLMLTAVLINKMILDMYLNKFVFTSINSDDFQLYCVIWK